MGKNIAIKYAKSFAKDLGIDGEYGANGVDDNTALNAFCNFMNNPDNEDSSVYWNISHQIYLWHSLASIRKLEHRLGFGIRPPKSLVDLVIYGYENGSTSPKFKRSKKNYINKETN